MSLPIKLIAIAPGLGTDGDWAVLQGSTGAIRKVRRNMPAASLKAMLRGHGIKAKDPKAAAFVMLIRAGKPEAT